MRLKRKTKSIISGILCVGLIAGVLAGAIALFGGSTKTVSSFEFSVGAIDENGNHIKNSKQAIYTEDLIECQALTIEADYEADGTYQVFYYAQDKKFIGASDVMNTSDGLYEKGDTFQLARYCRIMITPAVPVDEDGNAEADFKIRFYEVYGYASDYTITVDKKQNYKFANLDSVFVWDDTNTGKYYKNNLSILLEMPTYTPSEIIEVSGKKEVIIYFSSVDASDAYSQLCVADESGDIVDTINFSVENCVVEGNLYSYKYELSEAATHVVLNAKKTVDYLIFVL